MFVFSARLGFLKFFGSDMSRKVRDIKCHKLKSVGADRFVFHEEMEGTKRSNLSLA